MEYIFTIISIIFAALFITIFVLDRKRIIDVSGKGYSLLLIVSMPLATGLGFLDISIINNALNWKVRSLLIILILVFSVMLFVRTNNTKIRNGYNAENSLSKIKQKLIYGIVFYIFYNAAI